MPRVPTACNSRPLTDLRRRGAARGTIPLQAWLCGRESGRQPRRARESTRARRNTVRRTFWVLTAALAVGCLTAAAAGVARPAGGDAVTIGISLSLSGDFSD